MKDFIMKPSISGKQIISHYVSSRAINTHGSVHKKTTFGKLATYSFTDIRQIISLCSPFLMSLYAILLCVEIEILLIVD